MDKKVSVIIPLYNQKQYIAEAIESVLAQTHSNIQIVVVNDGSTDEPFSVLEKYLDKIALINQQNKGLAAARNTGIRNCDGEFVQFLDADDFLHKDKIRLQLEYIGAKDNVVSYCEIAQYYEDSQKAYLRYIGEVKDIFSHLYNVWYPYPVPIHSLLFKKSLFERCGLFDEGLKAAEDKYLLSKLAVSGVNFEYLPFIGGVRRRHNCNMNIDRLHIINNLIKYYQRLNRELKDSYFLKRFGYTGRQMMCANLTCLYGAWIADGTSKDRLMSIKKSLRQAGIDYEVGPIPLGIKRFKGARFFLASYLKRWWKKSSFIRRLLPLEYI